MPLTLFCNSGRPETALSFLEENGGAVERGDDGFWRVRFSWKRGFFKKHHLTINYAPDVHEPSRWQQQLAGMLGYFGQFDVGAEREAFMHHFVPTLRFSIGFVDEPDIADGEDERLEVVHGLAEHMGGVIFFNGMLMDSSFRSFAGPLEHMDSEAVLPKISAPATQAVAEFHIDELGGDPTAHRTDEPDPEGDEIRESSRRKLTDAGFSPAESLPTLKHRAGVGGRLRPPLEILERVVLLNLLNAWVYAPESVQPSLELLREIDRLGLRRMLREDEKPILAMTREEASDAYGNTMGWTQENMWSLAWVLGFSVQPPLGAPLIDDAVVGPLLDFLPSRGADLQDFISDCSARSEREILELEDLFFCAHNAARSAQMGSLRAVPESFEPMAEGGAIHERRHSLTWCLSPGVAWDETDLST